MTSRQRINQITYKYGCSTEYILPSRQRINQITYKYGCSTEYILPSRQRVNKITSMGVLLNTYDRVGKELIK